MQRGHWHYFLPVLIGVMATSLVVIGLRALITRRPFLFSVRWLLLFGLLGLGPALLMPDGGLPIHEHVATAMELLLEWAGPVLFVVALAVWALRMRGYLALAVTEASLREALLDSLQRLRLPHEEASGSVRLPSVPGELQVAVQGWMGTGQLKAGNPQSKAVLNEIAQQMNEYFRTQRVGVNLICPLIYTLVGLLLAAMDAVIVTL